MRLTIACCLAISSLLSACGGGSSSAQADARKAAAALTGDDQQAASDNPQCKLFTPAELAKYVGEPLAAGSNAAGGCQWVTTHTQNDGSHGDVMVVVVPARFHERPSLAPGFKELPDVGEQGFVAEDLGGWVAGAIIGKDAVRVAIAGTKAGGPNAIALLKETIARRAK